MMRSPWRIATAVRHPDGSILVKAFPFISLSKRHRWIALPVVRGVVGLYEALRIGIQSLNWSAEIASEAEEIKPATGWGRLVNVLIMLVAFAMGIGLFMAVPYALAGIPSFSTNQVYFHLLAGCIRILLLIGYMGAISLLPEINQVFRYHGSEHKSIFAFEKKLQLTIENALSQSRFHPRCGTSFLLLAAILTMLGFMLIDSFLVHLLGSYKGVIHRILIHLPLLPLVAGVSYEALRLIERHSDKPAWHPLVLPGFLLQRITTREPSGEQLEVALAALQESLIKEEQSYLGSPRSLPEESYLDSIRKVG